MLHLWPWGQTSGAYVSIPTLRSSELQTRWYCLCTCRSSSGVCSHGVWAYSVYVCVGVCVKQFLPGIVVAEPPGRAEGAYRPRRWWSEPDFMTGGWEKHKERVGVCQVVCDMFDSPPACGLTLVVTHTTAQLWWGRRSSTFHSLLFFVFSFFFLTVMMNHTNMALCPGLKMMLQLLREEGLEHVCMFSLALGTMFSGVPKGVFSQLFYTSCWWCAMMLQHRCGFGGSSKPLSIIYSVLQNC